MPVRSADGLLTISSKIFIKIFNEMVQRTEGKNKYLEFCITLLSLKMALALFLKMLYIFGGNKSAPPILGVRGVKFMFKKCFDFGEKRAKCVILDNIGNNSPKNLTVKSDVF